MTQQALAQVTVEISFAAPPPLVVVSPGIQVVPDYDHEVFVVEGIYWSRVGTVWYQSPDYRGGWVVVEAPRVPATLVKIPPGHYKRWKGPKDKADKGDKGTHAAPVVVVKQKGNNGNGNAGKGKKGGKGKKK
jgi:hypothetical protein